VSDICALVNPIHPLLRAGPSLLSGKLEGPKVWFKKDRGTQKCCPLSPAHTPPQHQVWLGPGEVPIRQNKFKIRGVGWPRVSSPSQLSEKPVKRERVESLSLGTPVSLFLASHGQTVELENLTVAPRVGL
jgi:hypothetical protein